jgi:hypothetical protein
MSQSTRSESISSIRPPSPPARPVRRPSPPPTQPSMRLPPLVVALHALASTLTTDQRTVLESHLLRLDDRTMKQLQVDVGVTLGGLQSLIRSSGRVLRTRLRQEQFAGLRSRLLQLREGLGSIAPLDHPHTPALLEEAFGSDVGSPERALILWLAGPYTVRHGQLVLLGTTVATVTREATRVVTASGAASDELQEVLDRHGVAAPFRASLVAGLRRTEQS